MNRLLANRWTKITVWLLSLIPFLVLAWRWQTHNLGVNPPQNVSHYTGDWILRFLLLTLLVTPLRKIPGLNQLIRYRRMFGLYAFFYACVHVTNYIWLDKDFYLSEMVEDLTKRRFYIWGAVAFTTLIPLAITSTKGWMRRLGRKWQLIHRLIYVTVMAGVIHYALQAKFLVPPPVYYGVIFAALLAVRVVFAVRRRLKTGAVKAVNAPATVS